MNQAGVYAPGDRAYPTAARPRTCGGLVRTWLPTSPTYRGAAAASRPPRAPDWRCGVERLRRRASASATCCSASSRYVRSNPDVSRLLPDQFKHAANRLAGCVAQGEPEHSSSTRTRAPRQHRELSCLAKPQTRRRRALAWRGVPCPPILDLQLVERLALLRTTPLAPHPHLTISPPAQRWCWQSNPPYLSKPPSFHSRAQAVVLQQRAGQSRIPGTISCRVKNCSRSASHSICGCPAGIGSACPER